MSGKKCEKKAMDIHVYELKVNLPILVYSSADREYVSDISFPSDNKGHIHFLKLEFWEICMTLKALTKWSLLEFFVSV